MSGKIHTIGGVKYREVKRKANVGEKIVIVDEICTGGAYGNGDILTVSRLYNDDGSLYCYDIACDGNYSGQIDWEEYRVLEPLEEPEQPSEPTSPALLDLIAKLTTKVMALESEVASLRELSESNSEDIALLDERTQVLNAVERFYAKGGASL